MEGETRTKTKTTVEKARAAGRFGCAASRGAAALATAEFCYAANAIHCNATFSFCGGPVPKPYAPEFCKLAHLLINR